METEKVVPSNFIRAIIDEDRASGKNEGKVITRFPPEPNGFLHIGHAKSICLNFGLAKEYNGRCHLRFDDTNPLTEDDLFVQSIQEDVRWLGFDWQEHLYYASDYFEQLYQYAEQLILGGKAYVCSLSADEVRKYRGTLTEPGTNSPYRDRSVEENLELFRKMRAGEFPDGAHTLRAKIDMSSGNVNMRDPAIYRIRHAEHHRTGSAWCIYPMYDYTHCISDALEEITHSICTLEFEDHRPLYDWVLEELKTPCHPQQIEFARLNLTYTVLSKRKLLQLVNGGYVHGWDDPRMPTIAGFRRRGYTASAIRDFCERIGVAKADSTVDVNLLEFCLREDLNKTAHRVMVVLDPLKVVIENYPEGEVEQLEAENNPEDASAGKRMVPFSRELYIERDDFMETPSKQFHRLAPGMEVRLKHAYYVTCTEVVKDSSGAVIELRCSYDPKTRGGWSDDGRKIKGTLHWVSAPHAKKAEVRLYDHLFTKDNPNSVDNENLDFLSNLNPQSLQICSTALIEPAVAECAPGTRFQFLRLGYFCADSKDHSATSPVFNRTVSLKDSWAKIQNKK
jgi:glutaminyl-tRNA synthetase